MQPKRRNKDAKRRVLVIRFSALGDVALTIPELYNVCEANPDVEFVMLTGAHPASLFINRPDNLEVVGVMLTNYRGVGGMRRLLGEVCERYGIDTIVDIHDVIRSKLIRAFGRLKGKKVVSIRKGRMGKRRLTRRNNKALIQLTPTNERYRDAFRRAGFRLGDTFNTIFKEKPSPEVFAAATPPKQAGERWIAVAPFAKHEGKIYPVDLMEKVVEQLASEPGNKLFILGYGTKETEIIDRWISKYPNIINLARLRIGIPAELALMSYCDVMLSMDSANMHLASLVGLRTVSVWGATHPYAGYMGWHQNPEDAVQLDMTCRPCSVFGNKPCHRGDYHCLRGISPQLIIDKINEK